MTFFYLVHKVPSKQVEQPLQAIRGVGAMILIALDNFSTRICCAVVKKVTDRAAQIGAAIYIDEWKILQLHIANCL